MSDTKLADSYLALTRQALTPSPALKERVQARVWSEAAAASASAAPAKAVVQLSKPMALLSGAVLLGLGFLAGRELRPLDAAPPPLPVPRAVSLNTPELVPLEPRELGPAPLVPAPPQPPAARAPADAAGRPAAAAPAAPPPSSREELALLQRAERAVRAGNSALALQLVAELEQRYPRSELLEERSAIEVLAHCVASASDARPRAERFLRAHPRSVYVERIGTLCEGSQTGSEAG